MGSPRKVDGRVTKDSWFTGKPDEGLTFSLHVCKERKGSHCGFVHTGQLSFPHCFNLCPRMTFLQQKGYFQFSVCMGTARCFLGLGTPRWLQTGAAFRQDNKGLSNKALCCHLFAPFCLSLCSREFRYRFMYNLRLGLFFIRRETVSRWLLCSDFRGVFSAAWHWICSTSKCITSAYFFQRLRSKFVTACFCLCCAEPCLLQYKVCHSVSTLRHTLASAFGWVWIFYSAVQTHRPWADIVVSCLLNTEVGLHQGCPGEFTQSFMFCVVKRESPSFPSKIYMILNNTRLTLMSSCVTLPSSLQSFVMNGPSLPLQ